MPAIDADQLLRAVGRRLAELRAEAGLTQETVAAQVGVAPRYLQRVEAGEENLTLRSLATLASALGVTMAAVFVPPTSLEARPGRPAKKKPVEDVAKDLPRSKPARRSTSSPRTRKSTKKVMKK